MSLYPLALFVHVSGAIGAFVSLGIWLFGLAALRRARRVEQVRALAWLILVASPLMVLAVLLGLAGLAMALSAWGLWPPWIAVSLVSVVLVGPIGAFVLDPHMRAILALAREVPDESFPADLERWAHDPILGTSAHTLVTILLGIVFLMTTKPALYASILVMVLASALGLVSSLPFWTAKLRLPQRTTAHVDQAEADPFVRTTLWTRRW
jgi:hypothetical protein